MSEAAGTAGPEVIRRGELALLLINCSTQESGIYTSPGKHSRAGPKDVGVGETTRGHGSWRIGPVSFS